MIEVITGVTPGYGGPTVYWSRIIWNNKELAKVESTSAYNCGYQTAKFEHVWKEAERFGSLERLAAEKPQAFHRCDVCLGECRTNHYQYDFHVCSEPCRAEGERQYFAK